MWETDLINAGIPGLVGVAGILGTFFAPAWATRKAARRRERRDFRTASRLVLDELETIEIHFRLLVEDGRVPTRDLADGFLPTAAWNEYKAVLAEMLDDNDWAGIPTMMGTIDHHRLLIGDQGAGTQLSQTLLDRANEAADLVHELRERLERAAPVDD